MNFQFSTTLLRKNGVQLIAFLIISSLVLPFFVFAQIEPISLPKNLEEVKEMGKRTLETAPKELTGILKKIWKEEVIPLWQKMYQWFKKNIWDPYIGSFLKNLKKEFEKRKPVIGEEFKKEKQEMKEEIKTELPKTSKTLWEKFKELIR